MRRFKLLMSLIVAVSVVVIGCDKKTGAVEEEIISEHTSNVSIVDLKKFYANFMSVSPDSVSYNSEKEAFHIIGSKVFQSRNSIQGMYEFFVGDTDLSNNNNYGHGE